MEHWGGGLSTAQGQGRYLGIVSSGAEQDLSKYTRVEVSFFSCLFKQVKGELLSSRLPNIPQSLSFSCLHYSVVCFSSGVASVQIEAVPKFSVGRDNAAAECGTRVCLLGFPWAGCIARDGGCADIS